MRATFNLEKETKNAVRYKEEVPVTGDPVIETVYLKKRALPDPPPKQIMVEVSWS